MTRILTIVAVVVLFVLSPSILNVIGIGYASGNPIFGIHLSAYALVLAALAPAVSAVSGGGKGPPIQYPAASIYTAVVCGIMFPIVFINGDSGFRLTIIVVTYLSPALVLFLLRNREPSTLKTISYFLIGFVAINSAVGLFEFLTGNRVLPYVVGLETVDFDPRPTAFLAHPLNNALVTGGMLLSLLILAVRRGPRPLILAGIAFFTASMFSFGGRAALVGVFVVFALFAVSEVIVAALTLRAQKSVLRTALIVLAIAIAAPIVLASPLAASILDRFANATDSDRTRVVALNMLSGLSSQEMMFGLSTAARTSLQNSLGSTRGVELSWISLVLHYGFPAAAALIIAMIAMVWSAANRNRDSLFIAAFFVLTTFGSLSIGSRSLLISQFVVLIFCGPLALYGVQRSSRSGRAYKVVKRRIPAPGAAGGEVASADPRV